MTSNYLVGDCSNVTQGTSYEVMGGQLRLALLEALLAVVADTEAVRGHMLAAATLAQEQNECSQTGPDKHMGLLGSDAAGARYYLLAGDVGGSLFDLCMHPLPCPMDRCQICLMSDHAGRFCLPCIVFEQAWGWT